MNPNFAGCRRRFSLGKEEGCWPGCAGLGCAGASSSLSLFIPLRSSAAEAESPRTQQATGSQPVSVGEKWDGGGDKSRGEGAFNTKRHRRGWGAASSPCHRCLKIGISSSEGERPP